MKTAISIPDPLFKSISYYVKKKGISRSKLISEAIEEYIKYNERNEISTKLNQVYSNEHSFIEKPVLNAQIKSIEKEEW